LAFGLVGLLALPAAHGRDEPKDKAKTSREEYAALVKEFTSERQKLIAELQKLKGEEQQKLIQKYLGLGKNYADRFFTLAEKNPNDPVATDALFWILQNASGHKKAEDKLTALVAEMPLKELNNKLQPIRGSPEPFLDAVLKRAEKEEKDPLAGDLLGWIASNRMFLAGGVSVPSVEKATTLLLEKYPDHPAIERICRVLSRGRSPKDAETLKTIIEKTGSPQVKAEATLALGQNLAAKLDSFAGTPEHAEKLAAEADRYLAQAVEQFGKQSLSVKQAAAAAELKAFRSLQIGKEAPEIAGKDLDGKEFKLSDYRGKVVLLDFWGNW
jgi:hypothetical protein